LESARLVVEIASGALSCRPASTSRFPQPKSPLSGERSSIPGGKKEDILKLTQKFGVDFLRLQFTDITGINKNVEVPSTQFDKALEGDITFDGSSIEGFVRIEESDMMLKPDLDTFKILPYDDEAGGSGGYLRYLQPGRISLSRLSPSDPAAADRTRPEAGLRDDGGLRG